MSQLTHAVRFHDGEIVARFTLGESDIVLLGVPGGPGLGGGYLDPFIAEMSVRTGFKCGMLDLPNHGDSKVHPDRLPLTYPDCLAMLTRAFNEVFQEAGKIVLFGQSLGARLVFDALGAMHDKPAAVLLAGFPYKFESSAKFYMHLAGLNLEDPTTGDDKEERFARNWRKILPVNLKATISPGEFDALAGGTKWLGNERMLEGAPPIEPIATGLSDIPIAVFEGEHDPVVPDGNLDVLRKLIPHGHFEQLLGAGHFPMVERKEETLTAFCRFISTVVRHD